MDKELLFFFISIFTLATYRMILSICLLKRKIFLMDEKFYVGLFYISLVDILVILLKNITVGIILVLLLPFVLTIYIAFSKSRVYWIINGYNISPSTFNNSFKEINSKYEDLKYTYQNVRFLLKKDEKKTKIVIECKDFKEKEAIKNKIIVICKENCKETNKIELIPLIISIFCQLGCLIGIMIVLFI